MTTSAARRHRVLRKLPDEIDAVVSLCRLADDDMRDDIPHVEFG